VIITYKDLVALRNEHSGKIIAYSGGVFDLLHEGHLDLFKKLKEYGEIVVVGVTPDERVKFRKGSDRPIHSQDTRAAIIDALRYVDYVFVSPIKAPGYKIIGHRTLKRLKPNYFISMDPIWLEDEKWLEEQGTITVIIPRFSEDVSTTQTITKIVALHEQKNKRKMR